MKIYYIYFHDTDFIPIHVFEIINEMQRRGHKVNIFTSVRNQLAKEKFTLINIKVHNLWTIRTRFVSELFFMTILFPYLLVMTLVGKPDYFYSRHSAATFPTALVARIFKIPCFVEINDIVLDKLKFLKVSRLKKKWVQLYHYANFRLSSFLLPVTDQIGSWLIYEYGLHPNKVIVIPNGVNVHRFSPKPIAEARKRYNIHTDAKVVLSLGSLFPWAGIEILIASALEVLKKYPDTLFVIGSGEEPYVSHLKKEVNLSGLKDHFLFFGFIPWDEASWFISTSNICVAPFIFKDIRTGISSLRVFSYLACARPVIGSDISGLGDMLESQGIGISFPMGNQKALAEAIIYLLDNTEKIKKMGERSRAYIINNHSWESIVDKIEAIPGY